MYSGLDELWIISRKEDSIKVALVHTIVDNIDNSVIDVLPAVHALKGYDTTGKASIKSTAFQAAMKCGYELLYLFGKSEVSDKMISLKETFLVGCISKNSKRNNFVDTGFETYHQKSFQLDLEYTTNIAIHLHSHKTNVLIEFPWLHIS